MAFDFIEQGVFRVANKLQSLLASRAVVRAQQSRIRTYFRENRRPWATGYSDYKMDTLRQVLTDETALAKFRNLDPLPGGYAVRLDARLVEIPWTLARLVGKPAVMLDAGSSLNHLAVLECPAMLEKKLTILTLAPEKYSYCSKGISYIYDDLRALPFRDNHFDVIACISTIEHVGLDNSQYAKEDSVGKSGTTEDFLTAIAELKRVLKLGGVLYITFPFGRYENHGWFQQFDAALVDKLIQSFGPSSTVEAIYQYAADGWMLSNREATSECTFFDVHTSKYFDPTSHIDFPSDYPAGEHAVACLELHN